MKKLIFIMILWSCGLAPLPPLPPLGCDSMQPVCVCDNQGNCFWQFICSN